MSTRRRVWTYVAVFALAVAIYYPFSPGGKQGRNMRRAASHIRALTPRPDEDPRFRNVRLQPFTGKGGSLGVFGTVATHEDAAALRSLVEQSRPPVPVAFHVIVPAAGSQPATSPHK